MTQEADWTKIAVMAMELASEAHKKIDIWRAVCGRVGPIPNTTFWEGVTMELTGERGNMSLEKFKQFAQDRLGREDALEPLQQTLLRYLRGCTSNTSLSLLDLSEHFDRSPGSVRGAAQSLRDDGLYNVVINDDTNTIALPRESPTSHTKIPLRTFMDGDLFRFGVIADTHLCNRNARLDALNALYDIYEAEGVHAVFLAGNLVDGEWSWNRQELLRYGIEGQICYAAENFPKRDGVTTYFITANDHEGWWCKYTGLDVGRHMKHAFEQDLGRPDLKWIGHVEADYVLDEDHPRTVLRISHPGGGTAYALSYTTQKIVESLQGGEKPMIMIVGHFHKFVELYPRNVYVIQPGCVEDQTLFMRTKKIDAHVGGCLISTRITTTGGLGWVDSRFIPFYDRGYYQAWDYRSMFLEDTEPETVSIDRDTLLAEEE